MPNEWDVVEVSRGGGEWDVVGETVPGTEKLGGAPPAIARPPQPVMQPVDVPSLASDVAGGLFRGAVNTTLAVPRVLGRLPGGFQDQINSLVRQQDRQLNPALRNPLQPAAASPVVPLQQQAEQIALPDAPVTGAGQFSEMLGSTLPYIAMGGPAGAAVLGVAGGSEEALSRADQSEQRGKRLSPIERAMIGAGGAAIGSTEALPLGRLFSALRRTGAGGAAVKTAVETQSELAKRLSQDLFPRWRDFLKSGLLQAGEEGGQELASGLAQDTLEASYGGRPVNAIGDTALTDLAGGGGVGAVLDVVTKLAASRLGRARLRRDGFDPDQLRDYLQQQANPQPQQQPQSQQQPVAKPGGTAKVQARTAGLALAHIKQNGAVTKSDLVGAIEVGPAEAGNVLAHLQAKGYVTAVKRGNRTVYMTPEAAAAAAQEEAAAKAKPAAAETVPEEVEPPSDPGVPRPPQVAPATGRETKIAIPGESKSYPARYAIREASDVFPSHNPANFERNPAYEHENDRDYKDPENSSRVVKYSTPEHFDPSYLVADNPTAEHGPTVIDERGNALGGNNRLMVLNRVYQSSDPAMAEKYKTALRDRAAQFGIDPAEVDRFQRPVLVRERSSEIRPKTEITDYNKKASANLRPGEQAITDGKRLSRRSLDEIVGRLEDAGEDGSLADALRGDNGAVVADLLVRDGVITEQEKAGLLDERESLTPEAKARVAKALVGRLFTSSSQYNQTPPAIRSKLERIAPHVLRVDGRNGWSLTQDVRAAVDVLQDARAHGIQSLAELEAQTDISGRTYSPRVIALAKVLQLPPTRAAAAFRRYANDEAYSRPGAQEVMFTPPTQQEAFGDAFEAGTARALRNATRSDVGGRGARVSYRPGRDGQPGVLYANREALEVLTQVGKLFDSPDVSGVHVDSQRAAVVVANLRAPHLQAIRNEFRRAAADPRGVVVVDAGAGRTLSDVKGTVRHERFHATETALPAADARQFLSHPAAAQAAKRLRALGYSGNPVELASEVAAHIAQGPSGWSQIGVANLDDAATLLRLYLDLGRKGNHEARQADIGAPDARGKQERSGRGDRRVQADVPGEARAARRPRDNRTGSLFDLFGEAPEKRPVSSPPSKPSAPTRPATQSLFTSDEENASRAAAQRDQALLQKAEAEATFASPIVKSTPAAPKPRPRPGQASLFDAPAPKPQASLFDAPAQPTAGAKPEPATETQHDYASTQLNLPEGLAKRVREAAARIPDADLAENGRENQPHVTVKYGLHGDNDAEVRKLLAGEGLIKIKLGKATLFRNDEADVLKVDVESEDLARLHEKLKASLPNTETHPEAYKPHVTIAYLKPGRGAQYAGKPVPGVSGIEVTLGSVAFSPASGGEQVEIPLQVEPKPAGATPQKQKSRWRLEVEQNGRWTEWNTYESLAAAERAESQITSGSMGTDFGTVGARTRVNEFTQSELPAYRTPEKKPGFDAAMQSADDYERHQQIARGWVRNGVYPDMESAMAALRPTQESKPPAKQEEDFQAFPGENGMEARVFDLPYGVISVRLFDTEAQQYVGSARTFSASGFGSKAKEALAYAKSLVQAPAPEASPSPAQSAQETAAAEETPAPQSFQRGDRVRKGDRGGTIVGPDPSLPNRWLVKRDGFTDLSSWEVGDFSLVTPPSPAEMEQASRGLREAYAASQEAERKFGRGEITQEQLNASDERYMAAERQMRTLDPAATDKLLADLASPPPAENPQFASGTEVYVNGRHPYHGVIVGRPVSDKTYRVKPNGNGDVKLVGEDLLVRKSDAYQEAAREHSEAKDALRVARQAFEAKTIERWQLTQAEDREMVARRRLEAQERNEGDRLRSQTGERVQTWTPPAEPATPAPPAEPGKMRLTGDTYRYRNLIKQMGARWDGQNKAWVLDDTPANRDRVKRMSSKIIISAVPSAQPAAPAPARQEVQPPAETRPTPTAAPEVQTDPADESKLEKQEKPREEESPAAAGTAGSGVRRTAPGTGSAPDRAALEAELPATGARTEESGRAEEAGDRGLGERGAGDVGVPRPGDALGSGARTGAGGVGDTAGSVTPAKPKPPKPNPVPVRASSAGNTRLERDYRIPDGRTVGGSPEKRFDTNIKAIRLLRELEAEDRLPTPEEQETLAGYVGWGAVPQVFAGVTPEWARRQRELRELLSAEEYEHAQRSTTNAHYTSDAIVDAMWTAMEHLGAKPGMVWLEPAVGIGNFLGRQPARLLEGARRVGIDKDTITGKLAQELYPDSAIEVTPFEKAELPPGYFDAAISNVPFGDFGVHDPAFKGKPHLTGSIHNYFFAKTLAYVRPGGVVAFVTSRYTMDGYSKPHSAFREFVNSQADFLGAVRLPGDAFLQNAGTKVVTDIIFLRRRLPGAEPAHNGGWLESKEHTFRDGILRRAHAINTYYSDNPGNILGVQGLTRGQFSESDYGVTGKLTPEQLQAALERALPADAFQDVPKTEVAATTRKRAGEVANAADAKIGALFFDERGDLHRRLTRGSVEPVDMPVGSQVRVKRMLGIRDTLVSLLDAELNDRPHGALRDKLNLEYDAFATKFGPLSSPNNQKLLQGDPDAPLLLALETGFNGKSAKKAEIFRKRVLDPAKPVNRVETAKDAMMVSLNESGLLDWQRMSALTGKTEAELQGELAGLVYLNPATQTWQTADEYLSGSVRSKLRAARQLAKVDPRYGPNVKALEAVQPEDIPPSQIFARMGVTWVPTEIYEQFIREAMGMAPRNRVKLNYAAPISAWQLDVAYREGTSTRWRTRRVGPAELFDAAFNLKRLKVYDEVDDGAGGKRAVVNPKETAAAVAKQEELQQYFQEWLFAEPERADALARIYNDTHNDLRLRTYDGSHLTLPGASNAIKFHSHQKAATWRIISQPNTLLAHAVGAGKTFEMIAGGMELKRMGLIKRPMYVVPNATLNGWQEQFAALYPGARVLVFSEKDLEKSKRQQIMARIATGNWDAVVVPHSSFQFLPVSDELFQAHYKRLVTELEEALSEAREAKMDSRLIKRMEKAKERLLESLEKRRAESKKDRTVTWEQLGIDQLFVDEAHEYKKLGFATKQSNIAGIDQNGNQKTFDLMMKMRHVQQHGRGVVFATGTPITNTMGEMFTVMRYLIEDELKARGIGRFDEWAANFGRTQAVFEPKPEGGGYKLKDRFSKFVNLPELATLFRSFADVVTSDMLEIERPDPVNREMVTDLSDAQQGFMDDLRVRAEAIRENPRKALPDNMLAIYGDAQKMALDIRMVDGGGRDYDGGRLNQAADNIAQVWRDSGDGLGAQLVFMDLGIPESERKGRRLSRSNTGFSTYDELRRKLIERGIPNDQIATIYEARNKQQRQALFDAVRAGKIRVLMGSTGKMGVGVNVQTRVAAMHHMDLPHRPADFEQRNGRGIRQGNRNKRVDIFTYLTRGTLDELKASSLARKAKFINQVMQGKATVREAEDIGGMVASFEQFQAIASGDPRVLRKMEVDGEVERLSAVRSSWADQKYQMRSEAAMLPGQIDGLQKSIETLRERKATAERTGRTWEIGGKTFSGEGIRNQVAEALVAVVAKNLMAAKSNSGGVPIGSAFGINLQLVEGLAGGRWLIQIQGVGPVEVGLTGEETLGTGTVQGIENAIQRVDKRIEYTEYEIDRLRRRGEEIVAEMAKPWPDQAKLDTLLAEQKELFAALGGGKDDAAAAELEDGAEIEGDVDGEEADDGDEEEGESPGRVREFLDDTRGEVRLDFAVDLFRAGMTRFLDWARRMKAKFGEVQPRLFFEARKLWNDTRGSVGDLEQGPHGPIFREFHHDAAGAIAKLKDMQAGEAVGALHHPAVGDIDLIWGDKKFGLAKIVERHPEVLNDLQGLLDSLAETRRSEQTVFLEDEGHTALVRLNWMGKEKKWLLTAFEKKAPSAEGTVDVPGAHVEERQAPPPGGSTSNIGSNEGDVNAPAGSKVISDFLKDESGSLNLKFRTPPAIAFKLRNPGRALIQALDGSVVKDALEQLAGLGWRIGREGNGTGKALMDTLTRANDTGEVSAGKRLATLIPANLARLTREERFNLMDTLEGRADPMNDAVRTAFRVSRGLMDEIAAEAESLEVQVRHAGGENRTFEGMEDYYPHVIRNVDALKQGPVRRDVIENLVRIGVSEDEGAARLMLDEYIEFSEGRRRSPEAVLRYLVRTGQAANMADAYKKLQRDRAHVNRHGSIEHGRDVNLPFYDPDPVRVLPSHVVGASIRLAQIAELGQNNEVVNRHVRAIGQNGGNADWVRGAVDKIIGYANDADDKADRVSRFLRSLQGFKLGLAAIPNATQTLNTLLETDLPSVAAGIRALTRSEGRLFAVKTGAALDPVLHESVRELASGSRLLERYLQAVGFSAVERANRIIAANAGAVYAQKLLKTAKRDKRARAKLAELGIDVDAAIAAGALAADDVLRAGKKISDIAQFRARPQDLPEFASTPWGKVFFQFKSFAYQQSRFMKRSLWDEAAAGDYGRAARNFLIVSTLFPLAGEGVKALRAWLTGRERDEEGMRRYFEDIAAVGALGLLWDVIEGAQRRKLVETLAGPSVGMVTDAAEIAINKPLDPEAWKKFGYRHAPLGSVGRNVFDGRP